MSPPPRNHAKRADQYAGCKNRQHNQHLGRTPLCAKEKVHSGVLLVVQCESKQGEKNGRFKHPLKQPHEMFH